MPGPSSSSWQLIDETSKRRVVFPEDAELNDNLLQGLRAVTIGHNPTMTRHYWTRLCSQKINEKHPADYEVYYANCQLYAVSRLGKFFFYPVNIAPGVRRNVEVIRLRHDILETRGRVVHGAWKWVAGPQRCNECEQWLWKYIFECHECGWMVCNRCYRNMLSSYP